MLETLDAKLGIFKAEQKFKVMLQLTIKAEDKNFPQLIFALYLWASAPWQPLAYWVKTKILKLTMQLANSRKLWSPTREELDKLYVISIFPKHILSRSGNLLKKQPTTALLPGLFTPMLSRQWNLYMDKKMRND